MYFQDGQVLEISQVNDIRLGLPPKINVSRLTSHVCLWLCDGDCIGCTSWKRVPVCVGVLGGGGNVSMFYIVEKFAFYGLTVFFDYPANLYAT